jgi:hypothetical protein
MYSNQSFSVNELNGLIVQCRLIICHLVDFFPTLNTTVNLKEMKFTHPPACLVLINAVMIINGALPNLLFSVTNNLSASLEGCPVIIHDT